jgi:hypothetical protein
VVRPERGVVSGNEGVNIGRSCEFCVEGNRPLLSSPERGKAGRINGLNERTHFPIPRRRVWTLVLLLTRKR